MPFSRVVVPIYAAQAAVLGFDLACFLAFASSFCFFFFSFIFSSALRFKLAFSSAVFSIGLKKPSRRLCCALFIFFCNLAAPLRTLSSLKCFSSTRNLTSPSTSGASHLKSHSGESAGRTSGSRKRRRASAKGQSSGRVSFFWSDWIWATTPSRFLWSRMSLRAVEGPMPLIGSR